jgi:nicotine oxidoreductase
MDMNQSTSINRLKSIRELNRKNPEKFINVDLYKLLLKDDILLAGYEKIKSNKGATTPGVGKLSLDQFSRKRLEKLQSKLRNESWRPAPARRIYIPKSGKTETRSLGIQGPEEKVVQASMLLILEAIYEPLFCNTSFGFRPGKGVHNALQAIEKAYDGMTFSIEANIKGMYDNINQRILITLLEKRIKDDRFIRLIWKMLRAGYMEENKILVKPEIGTPQASIVSPILANIYLHELDLFMKARVLDVPIRNNKIRTPEYKLIDNRMKVIKYQLKQEDCHAKERTEYLKELRKLKIQSLKIRMYLDPSNRIVYTRYADDFIIGIAGSKQYTSEVKDDIESFLATLELKLNPEKTKITDIRKEPAFFLGHNILIDTSIKTTYVRPKGKSPYLKRVTGKLVSIQAPIQRIVKRLADKEFCKGNGFPTPKIIWSTQEDNQIIDNFNATARGIFGFYSGASKRNRLTRIWYILKFSCAYTLAFKHRKSLNKVFRKYGRNLTVYYGENGTLSTKLYAPSFKEKDRKWQLGHSLPDPYRLIALRIARTKIDESCCICGNPCAEMHHIRHVKDSKTKFTSNIMGLINRKQIPVCIECHHAIHNGRYNGLRLKDFVNAKGASR